MSNKDAAIWKFVRRVTPELQKTLPELKRRQVGDFAQRAETIVRAAFANPKPLRPSARKKKLSSMEKALRRAANTAEAIGPSGMLMIMTSSQASRVHDDVDPTPHVVYLRRFAELTRKASETAGSLTRSTRDDCGGRTPDQRLRSAVGILAEAYSEHFSLNLTHTIDPRTGFSSSTFDFVAKEALRSFLPDGVALEPSVIDAAIGKTLRDRKLIDPDGPPALP